MRTIEKRRDRYQLEVLVTVTYQMTDSGATGDELASDAINTSDLITNATELVTAGT